MEIEIIMHTLSIHYKMRYGSLQPRIYEGSSSDLFILHCDVRDHRNRLELPIKFDAVDKILSFLNKEIDNLVLTVEKGEVSDVRSEPQETAS